MTKAMFRFLGLVAVLTFMGCTPDHGDLNRWMADQRQQARSNVPPVAHVPAYTPVAYSGGSSVEPFDAARLVPSDDRGTDAVAARARQALPPLERHPLEAMVLVGTMERKGKRWAMLRMEEGLFYVGVGDRLGVHQGRVLRINDTELTVVEPVRDAVGRDASRTSVLTLKEATP